MTNEVVPQRWPWEPVPVAETVSLLQRDMAYMVQWTGVKVHSNRPELQLTVNVQRGQLIPRNEFKYKDGTTVEFQDLGMPQIGVQQMTIKELVMSVIEKGNALGLEIAK